MTLREAREKIEAALKIEPSIKRVSLTVERTNWAQPSAHNREKVTHEGTRHIVLYWRGYVQFEITTEISLEDLVDMVTQHTTQFIANAKPVADH